jgi:hypothetical protein
MVTTRPIDTRSDGPAGAPAGTAAAPCRKSSLTMNTTTQLPLLALPLILSAYCTGCTPAYLASNKDVTLIERGFGIRVLASAASTGNTALPEVDCGAFSSIIHLSNTSTNALYAAPTFSTASAMATANPFNTSIQETWGAGNVSANVQTNSAGGGTVVKAPVFQPLPPSD